MPRLLTGESSPGKASELAVRRWPPASKHLAVVLLATLNAARRAVAKHASNRQLRCLTVPLLEASVLIAAEVRTNILNHYGKAKSISMRASSTHLPIGRVVLALASILFLSVPLVSFHSISLKGVDFKTVYSSAKCLLNHTNPYDSSNLYREYESSGGDVSSLSDMSAFKPYQALYPPSSLFWVLPFALLPFKPALAIWLSVSGLLFVLAAFLMADITEIQSSPWPIILLGLFVATSMMLLITAQPSGIAISLCAIGVWSLLRNRYFFWGSVCFALSLALKPQIGAFVLAYFLIASGPKRRKAMVTAFLAALFCVPGLLWAAHNPAAASWPQKISTNFAGSSVPGSINDPGPNSYNGMLIADLQPVVALFSDVPKVYKAVSWAIGGSLIVIWLYIALRARPSWKRDVLGVAAIACLSLLPVYHRDYDVRLLLLTFPAVALLVAEGGFRGVMAVAISLASTFGSHARFINTHVMPLVGPQTPLKKLLLLRLTPITVLVSGVFYLVLFAQTIDDKQKSLPMPEILEFKKVA